MEPVAVLSMGASLDGMGGQGDDLAVLREEISITRMPAQAESRDLYSASMMDSRFSLRDFT